MPRSHRHHEQHSTLWPSRPLSDVPEERQAAAMEELRALQNCIARGYRARDERLHALATSNSLSRHDMALAIGLAKSRVDQIVREMELDHRARAADEALDRVRRHTIRPSP